MVEEGKSEELSFKLKEGKVKSSSFKSDNEKAFKICSSNGKQYIEAIKEGTGYVILTIKTTDKKTYTEKLFISVYKKVEKCYGIAQIKVDVYRGASENANVENDDKKGEVANGKKFYIIGLCEDFYLIQTTDGSKFADNYDSGFVRKKNIKVPISKIVLNKTKLSLFKDQDYKLTAKVLPEFTTESKKVTWSTSDKDKAVVYKDGIIYAKKSGDVLINAKIGNINVSCKVEIKEQLKKDHFDKKIKSNKLKNKISNKYRYVFLNGEYAFGKKYTLSRRLRKKLARRLVAAGYFDDYNIAKEKINEILAEEWDGSCYGMVVTIAINKMKQINVRKYTKCKGKSNQLDTIDLPVDNQRVANIINYYYASQVGMTQDETFYNCDDEVGLKTLVKNAERGYAENFGIYMWKIINNPKTKRKEKEYSGHQLLLLGYSKKKSNKKWYAIKCYDCSASVKNTYIYINKKFNRIRIPEWSDYNIYGFDCSLDFGRYSKIKIN